MIAVDVQHRDTVNIFKQRYNRACSNKNIGSAPSQRFMFGDKALIGSDVLDELGLRNGDVIRVQQGGLLGGISSEASSSSNDAVEPFTEVNQLGVAKGWAARCPKWLCCSPGLCLQGICTTDHLEDCVAYNRRVVMNY
jgi:hypothetical protein